MVIRTGMLIHHVHSYAIVWGYIVQIFFIKCLHIVSKIKLEDDVLILTDPNNTYNSTNNCIVSEITCTHTSKNDVLCNAARTEFSNMGINTC